MSTQGYTKEEANEIWTCLETLMELLTSEKLIVIEEEEVSDE